MKVRIGIVGCGSIANNKHLPSLSKLSNVEVVAYCDIIKEKAIETRNRFKWKDASIFEKYEELVQEDLDVVYVTTPNNMHCPISILAMKSGKHVMCEKPMANNSKEAKLMLDISKETKRILTIGYQNRYREDVLYLKELCKEKGLGEIYFTKAHAIRRRAVPTWGNFLDENIQGGGPLIDIGTHSLDLALWIMQNYRPVSVVASVYKKLNKQTNTGNLWGDWDVNKYNVEDSAFAFIKMENGATIFLESSWALNTLNVKEAAISICGTKGGADMDEGLRINSIKYNTKIVEKPSFEVIDKKSPEELEQENFIGAILGKCDLIVKPEEAYVVTKIIDTIYESAKIGKEIKISW